MEEIKLNIEGSNNEKSPDKGKSNKTRHIIECIIIIVISSIIFVSALIGLLSTENSKLEISNVSMSVEYNEYIGYTAEIKGTAKNVTNRNYSYASVEFSVYDASGNNLGTALANINNLRSGDTWNFKAILFSTPSTRPTTYKLVEITTW